MTVPDAQIGHLEMEPKYLMKTEVQLNPNILRMKNDKKRYCKKHQDNESLLISCTGGLKRKTSKNNVNLGLFC